MSKYLCLAKPSPVDKRDYPISRLIAHSVRLPEEYKTNINIEVIDQGRIGCCVACSLAYARQIRECLQTKRNNRFSIAWIYGNRRVEDFQGEGMEPREAIQNIRKDGAVLFKSLSGIYDYPNSKKKVGDVKNKLRREALKYRINSFYRCETSEDIKMGVMECGCVSAMFPAYGELMGNPINGVISEAKKRKPEYGYHQMTITGWKKIKGKEYWIVLNSWGSNWGDKGYCYIPIDGYDIVEVWAVVDDIK